MYKRRIFGRRGPSARFRLPLGLVLVVLGIALCILIPSTPINLSNVNVSDKGLPTPLDTSTPAPKPTKKHIGRLIFTCTRGDYNQLCMINADSTGYQQMTDIEAHNYYPVYSPLGGSIFSSSYSKVRVSYVSLKA